MNNGNSIEFMAVHEKNAPLPIVCIVSGSVMSVSEVQPVKLNSESEVTLSGITMLLSDVHSAKQ